MSVTIVLPLYPQIVQREIYVHHGCLHRVPNALAGRDSVNIEIFGMAGVPEGAAPGVTVPLGEKLSMQMLECAGAA